MIDYGYHGESDPYVGRRLTLTPASKITIRPVRWLWHTGDGEGRMPLGAVVIGAGRAGIGKSQFGAWLAAHITNGTLPGAMFGTPANVIYAAAEDSYEMTVVPRLLAAGADLDRVFRVDVSTETDATGQLTLPVDTENLTRIIVDNKVALLVLDPLLSMIDAGVNDYRAREIRTALEPLVAAADRTRCTVYALAHFTKAAGTDPLLMIAGSAGFGQLVRAAIAFARDEDSGDCVMSTIKNNLGREDLPSLTYTIEPVVIDTPEGQSDVSRFVFGEESGRHVRDMLRDSTDTGDHADRSEAVEWLSRHLTDQGGEAIASDVIKVALRDGLAKRTVQRARKTIASASKDGMGGPWIWRLNTEGATKAPKTPTSEYVASTAPSVAPSVIDMLGLLDASIRRDQAEGRTACPICGMPTTPSATGHRSLCRSCTQDEIDELAARRGKAV